MVATASHGCGSKAYTTSLDASSSPADFEAGHRQARCVVHVVPFFFVEVLLTLLALLFLKPVSPGQGTSGRLSLVKLGLLAWRLAEDRDPQSKFRRRMQSAITGNHPYTWLPSRWVCTEETGENDPEQLMVGYGLWRILRLNFRIASQATTAVAAAVAALSGASSQRPEDLQMRQAEIDFPAKSVREDVHLHMVEPKAKMHEDVRSRAHVHASKFDLQGSTVLCFPLQMVSAIWTGSLFHAVAVSEAKSVEACSEELRELMRLQLMVRLLETRLVEVLRFQRGQAWNLMHPARLGMRIS
ncbi:unnamed protein product [Symbiodinium sp. CCMP2592]|nr:unnamed protein product [Symbiodinium sp. CCMP2592]